jgi:hypothetical protein
VIAEPPFEAGAVHETDTWPLVADGVTVSEVGVPGLVAIVTVPVDADDKFPAASTAYALYVPSDNPAALNDVAVFAAEIVT